jgi:hypothetical protein
VRYGFDSWTPADYLGRVLINALTTQHRSLRSSDVVWSKKALTDVLSKPCWWLGKCPVPKA